MANRINSSGITVDEMQTDAIVEQLMNHSFLLYLGKIGSFPTEDCPFVCSMMQGQLSLACRLLQAERNVFEERFLCYRHQVGILESNHPNNPEYVQEARALPTVACVLDATIAGVPDWVPSTNDKRPADEAFSTNPASQDKRVCFTESAVKFEASPDVSVCTSKTADSSISSSLRKSWSRNS
jgi:hypothetical protein